MDGPYGIRIKHYSDQCNYCHWHMEGAPVKRPGETGIPVWCGAGADDYFMTGRACPSRLPRIQIVFHNFDDISHALIVADGETISLKPEVERWIRTQIPRTEIRSENWNAEQMITISFDSERSFILFKTFWL
jgi:hypothetical protein